MRIVLVSKKSISVIGENHMNQFLTELEFRKYQLIRKSRRPDWLSGRIALKQAFIEYYASPDINFTSLTVNNYLTGQPYIVGHDQLFCSLGHSNAWGVGVVSSHPVGVDIEKIQPHKQELLPYISDPEEFEELEDAHEQTANLITRIWTLKEAVMKGLGIGLSLSPKQLRIHKSQSNAYTFMVEVLPSRQSRQSRDVPPAKINFPFWRVFIYNVDQFFISVACGGNIHEIHENEKPAIHWYHPTRI